MTDRTFKPKLPAKTIATAVLIGAFIIGFIVFAVVQVGQPIDKAWMTGTIVSKEHIPYQNPEEQVTLNRDGDLSARTIDGEYILTVDVPQEDGTNKPFKVWMPNKKSYDEVKVGDSFNVGPYLQK